MKIGLIDADGGNWSNLAMMKISAFHKNQGDTVEWCVPILHYDKVYVAKVFGDEYSHYEDFAINADEVVFGGTGFAITIENGKEVYHKDRDKDLPYEVEHSFPDYSLYPELTKGKAYGFLTRGCCNDCSFCIVSKKEGRCSHKVADLDEFWNGQDEIILYDPNILACPERTELLEQLAATGKVVDFTQGLDARFITEDVAKLLSKIRMRTAHFAFDFMKNEKKITEGLKNARKYMTIRDKDATVYMLTNYDTTHYEDLKRIKIIQECGFQPDVRIYRKNTAPRFTRDLQRWCNNRVLHYSSDFWDYQARKDEGTMKEVYKEIYDEWNAIYVKKD